MIKNIFLLFFSIFLLSGCSEGLSTSTTDDSASITKALLTGTWTAKCSDNITASTSALTELVFYDSGDNLTATTTYYSNLSCVTQSFIFRKKLNGLDLKDKTTTSQNQIIYKFKAKITDISIEPKTISALSWNEVDNITGDTYCGLSVWSPGTETSVAGLTCNSTTYKSANDNYFDIIQMNSEKTFIRLGNITNAAGTGYPKTLYTQEYYKSGVL